jgi:DNA polymerase-1
MICDKCKEEKRPARQQKRNQCDSCGRLLLPNIRRIMVPDPGHVLVDIDLKGADARVVAWEANDEGLKAAFRAGADIHTLNAKDLFGDVPITYALRQRSKIGVHATNYGCKARTLGEHLQITTTAANAFISRWFSAHPGIADWHRRTERRIQSQRNVENAFGYRRPYFDRTDNLLPKALAWIGQSTTAIAINKLIVNLHRQVPECQFLLQTHDSVTFQVHIASIDRLWPRIRAAAVVTVPYDDPLEMPCDFLVSDRSWGEVKEWKEPTNALQ